METKLAGRYQIVQHLGHGGFGQTFLAKDNHLPGNPLCVVKQLKPKVSDPETLQTAKRLFDQEAEILYRLGNHNQIPQLLAHFEQNQEFYLVQEFIDGRPLDQEIILGKPLTENYLLNFLQDILQVLTFVHAQNVIHRDIKPANLIRRSRDNKIVLIDFGAVKEVRNQTVNFAEEMSLTVAVGSPGYMPIEQRSFKPHFSSDLYAVGIICLQALTGLSPRNLLPDEHTGELSCHLFKNYCSIRPDLAEIIDKMIRYDYRQRYKTAKNALEVLEQLRAQPLSYSSEIPTVFTPPNSAKSVEVSSQSPSQIQTKITVPVLKIDAQDPVADPLKNSLNHASISSMTPDFLQRCRQELARCIGPIADFILEDTLTQYPQVTPQQFVEALASEIANPQQAKEFKLKLS